MTPNIIRPTVLSSYSLKWKPEPFIATKVGDSSFEFDKSKLRPDKPIFLVCEINKIHFDRHAEYYIGQEYNRGVWANLKYCDSASPISLVSECVADGKIQSDTLDVYCFSFPVNTPVLFGKLLETNVLYELFVRAMASYFRGR